MSFFLNNLKEFASPNPEIGINTEHVFYRFQIHFIERP